MRGLWRLRRLGGTLRSTGRQARRRLCWFGGRLESGNHGQLGCHSHNPPHLKHRRHGQGPPAVRQPQAGPPGAAQERWAAMQGGPLAQARACQAQRLEASHGAGQDGCLGGRSGTGACVARSWRCAGSVLSELGAGVFTPDLIGSFAKTRSPRAALCPTRIVAPVPASELQSTKTPLRVYLIFASCSSRMHNPMPSTPATLSRLAATSSKAHGHL